MTCERCSKEMETKLHACVMSLPEIHADLRSRRQGQRIARNSHGSRGISKEISRTHKASEPKYLWTPPIEGIYIINTDGAMFQDTKEAAIVGVVKSWITEHISFVLFCSTLPLSSSQRLTLMAATYSYMPLTIWIWVRIRVREHISFVDYWIFFSLLIKIK